MSFAAACLPLCLLTPPLSPLPAQARPPNIVFIYTDDQARWGMGAYGNQEVRTPNLDRLATEGALFLNAFTLTPVCSPSRATMFTGRYPTECGIEDWINPGKEPDVGLSPDIATWPRLLKAAGYRTGLVGKWHLGTQPRFHPLRNGYDSFAGFLAGGIAPMDPTIEVEGKITKVQGAASNVLTDKAIEFLRSCGKGPFLLSLHFRAPHAPYAPVPEEDSRHYESLDPAIPRVEGLPVERVKKLTREYYGSISCVDRNVGRLLGVIDELGLRENTLVVFTSDHGYMIGHHGLHHKGNAAWILEGKAGHRPNFFDDAIRVPVAIRWPGIVKPGSRIDGTVSNLDFFPTLLEAAGVRPPPEYRDRGRSFLSLLRGEARAEGRTAAGPLFGQYDMHHYVRDRMRMLRTPRWKLVRHLGPPDTDELYDLEGDPGEVRNLAGAPEAAEVLRSLKAELAARMASVE